VLHDALHDGVGAADGVLEPRQARAEAVHGVLNALVESARQLVEDVDAGAERVQAPRVRAAPDRRDVDHCQLPRPEHVQSLPPKHVKKFQSSKVFQCIASPSKHDVARNKVEGERTLTWFW
jgi:hypothetical protein